MIWCSVHTYPTETLEWDEVENVWSLLQYVRLLIMTLFSLNRSGSFLQFQLVCVKSYANLHFLFRFSTRFLLWVARWVEEPFSQCRGGTWDAGRRMWRSTSGTCPASCCKITTPSQSSELIKLHYSGFAGLQASLGNGGDEDQVAKIQHLFASMRLIRFNSIEKLKFNVKCTQTV